MNPANAHDLLMQLAYAAVINLIHVLVNVFRNCGNQQTVLNCTNRNSAAGCNADSSVRETQNVRQRYQQGTQWYNWDPKSFFTTGQENTNLVFCCYYL